MDASYKLSKTALLLTAALSLAANAFATTTLTVTPSSSSVAPVSVPQQFTVTNGNGSYSVGSYVYTTGPTGWFYTPGVAQSGSSWVIPVYVSNCPSSQTCTGSFEVVDSANDSATVYITSAGGSTGTTGTFYASAGTSSASPLSMPANSTTTVIVYNTGTSQVNFNVTPSVSWLNGGELSPGCTPATGASDCVAAGSTATLTIYSYGYTTGQTTSGTLTLTPISGSVQAAVVYITLGTATSTGTLAAPTSLTFSCQSQYCAQPVPLLQTVVVNDTAPTVSQISYIGTFPANCGLSAGAGAGSLVTVDVSCSGTVTTSSYSGSVLITSSAGYQQLVPVYLNVYSAATLQAFVSNSGGTATCVTSSGTCNNQTMQLYSTDQSAASPTVLTVTTVTPSNTWITTSGCTGTTAISNCSLSINPAGLPNGLSSGSLTVSYTNSSSASSLTIPVVVLVSGSSNPGGLTTTTSLSFTSANESTAQSFSVNAGSAGSFTVSAATSTCGSSWLNVNPSGTVTNSGSLVTVQASILSTNVIPGSLTQCSGQISLVASNGVSQTIPVTLTLSGSTGGNITVTAGISAGGATVSSLSFTGQAGGSSPAAQPIYIASASGAAGIPFTVSTTSSGSWLQVTTTSGQTAMAIYVSATPANLTASGSPYSGTVTITPTGGTPVSIPVTFTVSAASSVSATATPLSFAYTAGNTAASPSSATITVSGTVGAQFTASATSTGNWLSISSTGGTIPASGSTPITVTLQNLTSLSVSTTPYTGTIVVAGSGGASGSTTISVTLTVSAPLPTVLSVTNAASFNTGPLSAGEVIAIFGTQMGPTTGVQLTNSVIVNNTLPTTLGGVSVTVGGYPAPMLYASATQVSAIVPYQINTPVYLLNVPVIVKFQGQTSNGYPETQVAAAPGIFTANSSGSGPGAILNSDLSFNCNCSTGRPANKGETVVLYLTGEGQTLPAGITGSINPSTAPFPQPVLAPLVTINGQPAQVSFYGEAPSLVAGVLQINVTVPATAVSGQANPVVVSFGGFYSQTTSAGVGAVTVAVK